MSNSKLLARVDIPIYMVKVVSERHILVAGGGGQANTGVKNAVEIYQLTHSSSTSDTCSAKLVNRFYTGSRAIMSGTVFENDKLSILAGGGINGECLLWRMRFLTNHRREPSHIGNGNAGGVRSSSNDALNLRRRRTSSSSSIGGGIGGDDGIDSTEHGLRSRNNSTASNDSRRQSEDISFENESIFGFELSQLSAFKTDFPEKEEPFVKVIRYNDVLSALVTGGADGHIRIWRYPDIVKQTDIRAHTDEIDDLDIHPRGTVICSVSRDSHGYIWDANMGRKQYELKVQMPVIKNSNQPVKYLMRGCRFGLVIDSKPTTYKLFTVHNPATRHKPPHPAYICKWDTNNYTVEKLSSIGPIMVSSMAISDDGRFIGIGTQEGSVEIYIAFSLQRQYNCPQAHNIFVTGLEFLKTCQETQLLTGDNDSSLVSISVDRRIVIHNIPKQRTIGLYGLMFCFAITIMSIFYILEYIGL